VDAVGIRKEEADSVPAAGLSESKARIYQRQTRPNPRGSRAGVRSHWLSAAEGTDDTLHFHSEEFIGRICRRVKNFSAHHKPVASHLGHLLAGNGKAPLPFRARIRQGKAPPLLGCPWSLCLLPSSLRG
jgi:hypothetical protein